jgi:diguanylate cyclase (GGDEF)-like protein
MSPQNKLRWLPQDLYSFAAIVLLLLTLALTSWFTSQHWISQRIGTQLEDLHQQAALLAAAATRDLQQSRHQLKSIARTLASLSSTRAFVAAPGNSTRASLQADLERFDSGFGLDGIWLLGPDRQPLLPTPAGPPPAEVSLALEQDPGLRHFILEPERRQATFYYATPVGAGKREAILLLRSAVGGPARQAYRVSLLVTDSQGLISLADDAGWLQHVLRLPGAGTTPAEREYPRLPLVLSPLLPKVLLLGDERTPVLLVSHAPEEGGYQVHAMADASAAYRLALEQDRLATLITLGATGSLWGGLLTVLTLKRNRRHRLVMGRANNELVRLNRQLKQLATTDPLTDCPNRRAAEARLQYELANLQLVMGRANNELVRLNRQLKQLATTDPLTDCPNRRAAEARLQYELANLQRYNHPFCIVMLDIDHFKHINDQHGHDTGDEVLRHFARLSRKTIRDTDILARIGGEEFLLILPKTDHQQGMHLAQRLLDTVAATPLYLADKTIGFTFSGGLTEARKSDGTNQLLVRADRALYRAKDNGRCRICSENLVLDHSVAVG